MLTTEVLIGVCLIIGLGATVILYLPSLSREENIARRINSIKNDNTKEMLGLTKRAKPGANKASLTGIAGFTVETLNLKRYLSTKDYKEKLFQAGYRSSTAENTFLFARFASPLGFAMFAIFELFGTTLVDWSTMNKTLAVLGAAGLGLKLPEILISNAMTKRKEQLRLAWPDALDLMVICVEAGMTVEMAFRKVSREIGIQSMALAEELTYTLAELSHLPDRSEAYKNLGERTGLDEVKSTCMALIQAEKQGTTIGTALRAMSAESRMERMQIAEKKAAGLGPKLTVPMILFFLPVLIAVIIIPGAIDILGWK